MEKFPVELLDVDNYATWSVKMQMLLIHKDLWETIEPPETPAGQAAPAINARESRKALSLICMHVKDHHVTKIGSFTTALDAWEYLKTTYQANTGARRDQLRRELLSLKKDHSEPLSKYFARARDIAMALSAIGHNPHDTDVTDAILNGLPQEYKTVRTILRLGTERHTIDSLLPKLLSAEKEINKENGADSTALVAQSRERGQGSRARSDDYNPHKDRECFYCHKKGHIKADCRKRKKDLAAKEASAKASGSRSLQAVAFMARKIDNSKVDFMAFNSNSDSSFLDCWIVAQVAHNI
jgi:hypothetical protein